MAKISGPLVSLGARGSLGKTVVYSSWRGVGYVRQHIIPKNPRSTTQVATRMLFSWLQGAWKVAPDMVQAVWTLAASGTPQTDRNLFTKANVLAIGNSAVLVSNIIISNGAKGGTPPTGVAWTPGSGTLALVPSVPTPPAGWTLTGVVAAAIPNKDPQTTTDYGWVAGENDVSPYHITLTGLEHSQAYATAAWIKWMKPDGTIAYSPGINSLETPT